MPSTVGGLLLFIVFLTPGFLAYVQRQRRVERRALSPLVELTSLVATSLATGLLALGIFAFIRWRLPHHTPDIEAILRRHSSYLRSHPGYVFLWGLFIFGVSSTLGLLFGLRPPRLRFRWLAPIIVDESAWSHVFDEAPAGSKIFVGCDLTDGMYVSGYLAWYNTDVDEVVDRDLVIAEPITIKSAGQIEHPNISRMIVSARQIIRLSVAFIEPQPRLHTESEA